MIRWLLLSILLFAALNGGVGMVKTRVQDLENRLTVLHREIRSNRTDIQVLKAEWSHLNDPARIRRLAETHLKPAMRPVTAAQIATMAALPPAGEDRRKLAETPAAAPRAGTELAGRRTVP